MQASSRVIYNTFFLYAKMLLSIVVNIFTTRILLEGLGISDYGIYSVVGGAISMLGFLSASMSTTTQRFLNVSEGSNDNNRTVLVFANAIIIHCILSLVIIIMLLFAGYFFFNGVLAIPEERLDASIIVYVCLIISTAFSVAIAPYDGVLNAHEDLHVYSLIGILDCLIKFLIALAIRQAEIDRLILYGISMAAASWLIRYLTKRYCCRKYSECKIGSPWKFYDKSLVKNMVGFAGWNLLNTSSAMITLYSMNLIINHYYGVTYNAAMGVATQLTGVLMAFSLNMLKALSPIMMKREGANNRESVLSLTYIGSKFAFIIFAIMSLPIYFCLDWILGIWLVDVPEYTSVFCKLLIVSILLEQYFVFLSQTIMAQGDVKKYCICKSIVNSFPIFSSIFMCSIGFSVSWVIVNRIVFYVLMGGMVNLYYCKRNLGLSYLVYIRKTMLPTIVSTGIIVCIAIMTIENTLLSHIVKFITIFLLSVTFYYLLSLEKKEKCQLSMVINNLMNKRNKTNI